MSERTGYSRGDFCWVDLATSDLTGAMAFYGGLFGWEFDAQPEGDNAVYTLCRQGGKDVCALFQMGAKMLDLGVPPQWNSYIAVNDVESDVQKAVSLGAKVIRPPFSVSAAGREAIIQDPGGAQIVFWQAKKHFGAGLVNEPGCWCWTELHTRKPSAAKNFYREMFGWGAKESDAPGHSGYTSWVHRDREMGGMLEIQPEWGEVPANWMVYFTVTDIAAATTLAQQLGGRAITQQMEAPGIGPFVVFQDPQGAHFTAIQMVHAEPE